ncbi:cell wall-binding repeat-containing protein [Rathayibacter sp. VKM Ac-2754]|uniref:cell wall-binding repeat-containing protein n=1 Tax=Rathayibacter sp. VKM Ac-2754 TaxID=2609251 RepID=UPI00135874F4|nr:cell wall-binding repeat-containing protein [Rathayibacter sp. VKM Ac-2754]MWV58039.1 hypothetical protein [Rathayibacter sp. VKM Ac-2754]
MVPVTFRRRRARPLSSLAIGALAVIALVAGPAVQASADEQSISGTIRTPAGAPGTHRYSVEAWSLGEGGPRSAVLLASTEVTLGSGVTGGYTLTGDLGGSSPVVRVVERPADGRVPAVGDEFWKDAGSVAGASTVDLRSGSASGIDLSPSVYAFSSSRVAGTDRYGTSVATTQAFEPGVPVLYIASGAKWADALSAGPAAAVRGGALLLTDPDRLTDAVSAEIRRLAPKKVIVVGSELTVSGPVYQQIRGLVGEITRIGGTDRYDTSRRLVADAFGSDTTSEVFLATGGNFPDALSIAPVAGRTGQPVLLVDGAEDGLDEETREAVARLSPSRAIVLGRTPSISSGIEKQLVSSGVVPATQRIGGASRYETSRLINEAWPSAPLLDTTYLASGEGFADALSGATVAAAQGVSVSLSRPDCVPAATVDSLRRAHIDSVKVLGSELTLSRAAGRVTSCDDGGSTPSPTPVPTSSPVPTATTTPTAAPTPTATPTSTPRPTSTPPTADVPAPMTEWDFSESGAPYYSTAGDLPLSQAGKTQATTTTTPWGSGVTMTGTSFLRVAAQDAGRLTVGATGNAVTVATWVYMTDNSTGFVAGAWNENETNHGRSYGLFYDLGLYGGDERTNFHVSRTGGPTPGYPYSRDYSSSGDTFLRDTWQLHVGTYDGTRAVSYLDGTAVAYPRFVDNQGNTYAKNPYLFPDGLNPTAGDFTVGAVELSSGPGNYAKGAFAKIRVWDSALTAEQVRALYTAESSALR